MATVAELFRVAYGHSLELNVLDRSEADNAINFVSRTAEHNGVSARVAPIDGLEPGPVGAITVALGGSVLATFVQQDSFYCGRDVAILHPKDEQMPTEERIWWAMCIGANRYRYNYGRQANRTLADLDIPDSMPGWATTVRVPDFDYARDAASDSKIDLPHERWQPFALAELFDIKGSRTTPVLDLEDHGPGEHPYVTTQATNNGVASFYDFYTERGRVLTVDSAVLGYTAYQQDDFAASDHVETLRPKRDVPMNRYVAMFLATVMNAEQYRYNYGRKCSQKRMKGMSIMLPATASGSPDWGFMEAFVRSLPYSSSL